LKEKLTSDVDYKSLVNTLDSHLRFIEVEKQELEMREGIVGVISPEEAFLAALKAYVESAPSLPIYC